MLSRLLQFVALQGVISTVLAVVPTILKPQFTWETNYDSSAQVPSCGTVTFTYAPLSGESAALKGPFEARAYADGFSFFRNFGDASNTALSSTMTLQVSLPVGTKVSFAMFDYNGYYGGAVGPYTVIAGSASCTLESPQDSFAVSFSGLTSDLTACGTSFTATETGDNTPPYFFGILNPNPTGGYLAESNEFNSTSILVEFSSLAASGSQFYFYMADLQGGWSNSYAISVGGTECGSAPAPSTTPVPPVPIPSTTTPPVPPQTTTTTAPMPAPTTNPSTTTTTTASGTGGGGSVQSLGPVSAGIALCPGPFFLILATVFAALSSSILAGI